MRYFIERENGKYMSTVVGGHLEDMGRDLCVRTPARFARHWPLVDRRDFIEVSPDIVKETIPGIPLTVKERTLLLSKYSSLSLQQREFAREDARKRSNASEWRRGNAKR